jgi:AbrB family looped-hinge helix DNA binding protein
VSSKGQIAIPKAIRDTLNLAEGSKLFLEIRGQDLILSREPSWKKLQGAGTGRGLMKALASFKREEREREDSRS